MRAFHAMLMLLGALAVLLTGIAPASVLADAGSPPCHEATMRPDGAGTPSSHSGKAMPAMHCCVACVAAPTLKPPARARLRAPGPAVVAPLLALPSGERPAPEPHPPRALPD